MTNEQRDFLGKEIERITPKLTSRLRRRFTQDQVEEILQEVYLVAARKVDRLMGHPNLDGWFMLVVEHKCCGMRTYLKQQNERFTSLADYEEFISGLTQDTIDEVLPPDTSPHDRMILKIYYELQLTTTEIGEELGVKPNCANQMLKRARNRLKMILLHGCLLLLLSF